MIKLNCFHYISGSQPGVHVPLGVREKLTGGMQSFGNYSKKAHLGAIFIWGVREEDTTLIWGYAEGDSLDLEIRKYQKGENPCTIPYQH